MVTTRKRGGSAATKRGRGRGGRRGGKAAEHGPGGDDAAGSTQGGTAAKRAKVEESHTSGDADAATGDDVATGSSSSGTAGAGAGHAGTALKHEDAGEPRSHAPEATVATAAADDEEDSDTGKKQSASSGASSSSHGAAGGSSSSSAVESHESRKSSFPPGHKPIVLERGHIFFFYRPKVMLQSASNLDEVQRMYLLLKPTKGVSTGEGKPRLLIVAKKHLPSAEGHGRKETLWAFVRKVRVQAACKRAAWLPRPDRACVAWWVTQVAADEKDVIKELEAEDYHTQTRGERHVEPARLYVAGLRSSQSRPPSPCPPKLAIPRSTNRA